MGSEGFLFLTISWLMLACAASSYPQYREEGDTSLGRLPTDLWPSHYVLNIQPDFYDEEPPFYFNGSVDITFEVRNPTPVIYLSNWRLSVDESSIYIVMDPSSPVAGPDPVLLKTEHDQQLEFYKIFLNESLLADAVYTMGMKFSGEILPPTEQYGLFYTTHTTLDGQTKYQVTTQLQSTASRRMFPNFDESMFKATFATTIVRKSHVIALYNTNLLTSEDRGDGWIADIFNTTVKMSSYLNCLVIGEFEYLETISVHGMPIRVWGRPEYMQDLQLALSVAAGIHDYYVNYTGIMDPIPKLDHIAVPGFNVGAMENWGLIPYGEFFLLYNQTLDTLADERGVVSVIGHETAHNWVGNLVTCRWWTDSWLNEGFASFFEDLPFDDVWGSSSEDEAIISHLRGMLKDDSSNTSKPVRQLAETPWDPTSSGFTYGKGSAVLRMLRQILGPDTLQRGIQRYLNRFAYDVAVTDDFWDALTEQAEIDGVLDTDGTKLYIKEKLDPWIDQRGYPLVTVFRTAPGSANVTQTHFLSPKDQSAPPSPFLYEWYVPMTFTSQETPDWNRETRDWLNRENKTITEGIPESMDQWFVANVFQLGFFRIKYDNATYFQLVDQLNANASVIPSTTRFSILNDAFSITRAGIETEVHAMETTRFLDQEDNYPVWSTADTFLEYPSVMLSRYPSSYAAFQDYMRSKLDPVYARLGWDNTGSDNFERSTRAVVIGLACNYGNSDCEQEARNMFDNFMQNPSANNIPVDLRVPVYCTTMRFGSQQDWDSLHAYYLDIHGSLIRDMEYEVDRVLNALACSEDDAILKRYFNMTHDPTQIRPNNVNTVINAIANSNRGRWLLWEHFNNTWDAKPVPAGADKWNPLQNIVEGFANDEDMRQLEIFMEKYPPADDYERGRYDLAIDTVTKNNRWANANQADLEEWLLDHLDTRPRYRSRVGSNHGLREMIERIKDVRRFGERSQWYNKYTHLL